MRKPPAIAALARPPFPTPLSTPATSDDGRTPRSLLAPLEVPGVPPGLPAGPTAGKATAPVRPLSPSLFSPVCRAP
jgi:hypothetical protein